MFGGHVEFNGCNTLNAWYKIDAEKLNLLSRFRELGGLTVVSDINK